MLLGLTFNSRKGGRKKGKDRKETEGAEREETVVHKRIKPAILNAGILFFMKMDAIFICGGVNFM